MSHAGCYELSDDRQLELEWRKAIRLRETRHWPVGGDLRFDTAPVARRTPGDQLLPCPTSPPFQ
jgi:hypothetical protein